jgi:hypothetical protein
VHRLAAAILTLAWILAGCGGGNGAPALDVPRLQWTWVDVPGTMCSDGSPTGLAVNPGPEGSTDVLVFLTGGGACWNEAPCYNAGGFPTGLATAGPYGQAQFQADLPKAAGTILDRTVTGSPFGGATLVFIPYCTGDVHWGNAATKYPLGLGPVWHHAGEPNLTADVAWLVANLPAPAKIVVSGSSAGGYGSLLAHDLARTAWPNAKGYLIDDSGPPLVGGDVPDAERAGWWASWNLSQTLDPLCPTCRDDLSTILDVLAVKYPSDRIALLSFRQDSVIGPFLLQTPQGFENALLQLVDTRIAPHATAHAFLVSGSGHALLQDFAAHSADGTDLPSWIRQMVQDEAGWTTLGRLP